MITNTRLICTVSLKAVDLEVILYEVILYVNYVNFPVNIGLS